MKSMMDAYPNHVVLKGMIFQGHTGVFSFEKEDGQPFIVDLTLAISHLPALFSDRLEDTVSYADIYECVKKIVENSRYDLLERLSMAVLEAVFALDGRIEAADVYIMKPKAPIEGTFDSMGVQLFRQRGCL